MQSPTETDGTAANLPRAFFKAAETNGDTPFLASKYPRATSTDTTNDDTLGLAREEQDKAWHHLSYGEAAHQVSALASWLKAQGVGAGARVMITAENRPEWAIADLAIMAVGAIVVPAYTTNTVQDHFYIIQHSEAVMAIVSPALVGRFAEAADDSPTLKTLLIMPTTNGLEMLESPRLNYTHWGEALNYGRANPIVLEPILAGIAADDCCCFIYTSGTGGRPKGVMLTHRSIQANIDACLDLLEGAGLLEAENYPQHRFLSFLPLSHAYEHTVGLHLPLQMGAEVWYSEGAEHIANNLIEAEPTLMTAVPRLYEVLYDRINHAIRQKNWLSRGLFRLTVLVGRRRLEGGESLLDRLIDPVLDRLVRRKVAGRFGGRLRFFISGGAALNPDIGAFFVALGVQVLQGYGQTEASPLISVNRPDSMKMDTVGPAVKGVEVCLSDSGEILVRGAMLMKGYWKDEMATAQAIRDGWLYTGDIGTIDGLGRITITGRAKEIIVNSGGDTIAPSRVEGILALEPEIQQVMVDGDDKPWLAAVIVPAESVREMGAEARQTQVASAVERANRNLSSIERVRRFILADEPFSIENSQMTPTLKTRRHEVRAIYGEQIDGLYGGKGRH